MPVAQSSQYLLEIQKLSEDQEIQGLIKNKIIKLKKC